MGDHEETLKIEYDDISTKTKPILTRFGSTFGKLRFDEKPFFKILLGFTPFGNKNLVMLFMLILRVYILMIKL